jgi:hypothetical protein
MPIFATNGATIQAEQQHKHNKTSAIEITTASLFLTNCFCIVAPKPCEMHLIMLLSQMAHYKTKTRWASLAMNTLGACQFVQ